jgi:hypothetical protein
MTGTELLRDAHPEASGPSNGALRFAEDGRLLAPTGDRRGLRLFDLTRKTSRIVGTGAKNFNAESGKLVYDVEVRKMEPGYRPASVRRRSPATPMMRASPPTAPRRL